MHNSIFELYSTIFKDLSYYLFITWHTILPWPEVVSSFYLTRYDLSCCSAEVSLNIWETQAGNQLFLAWISLNILKGP